MNKRVDCSRTGGGGEGEEGGDEGDGRGRGVGEELSAEEGRESAWRRAEMRKEGRGGREGRRGEEEEEERTFVHATALICGNACSI